MYIKLCYSLENQIAYASLSDYMKSLVLVWAVTLVPTCSCSVVNRELVIKDLEDAIRNECVVKLLEIADFVNLIPLETRDDCQFRDTYWYTQTPPYICVSGHLFDYSGRHCFELGIKGRKCVKIFCKPIDVLCYLIYV